VALSILINLAVAVAVAVAVIVAVDLICSILMVYMPKVTMEKARLDGEHLGSPLFGQPWFVLPV
jgi:flagellar biosynthesis protein FlhB